MTEDLDRRLVEAFERIGEELSWLRMVAEKATGHIVKPPPRPDKPAGEDALTRVTPALRRQWHEDEKKQPPATAQIW